MMWMVREAIPIKVPSTEAREADSGCGPQPVRVAAVLATD